MYHIYIYIYMYIYIYVIVINRRRGLYWFYKREAQGRVVPEAERLLNQYRPTAPAKLTLITNYIRFDYEHKFLQLYALLLDYI